MKYYAVKKGHTPGVYTDWTLCQAAISGYSGADFKKFNSEDEALAYINDFDIYLERIREDISNGYVVAFTDGSYDEQTTQYSYGVVIIDENLEQHELSNSSKNPQYANSRNISGEVFGLINAMDWAVSNGYSKLKIYHDYEGLSKWISGEWDPNTAISSLLVSVYRNKYIDVIELLFEHVKGHSNNRFNDRADQLASDAISNRVRKHIKGENWFSILHIDNHELRLVLDLLKEEEPEIVINETHVDNRKVYKLYLNKDKVTITNFLNGQKTLMVQGNVSLLFQVITSYLQELFDNREINILLSSAYKMSIDNKDVEESIKAIFGRFPDRYPESIIKLLKQSVINLKYYVESEDYSQYAFPVLRALEGHIKYILNNGEVVFKKVFECFNKENGSSDHKLVNKGKLNVDEIKTVEKLYKYYHNNRHTLFHFGDIIGSVDTTRIISEKEVVNEIISECLHLIKDTLD